MNVLSYDVLLERFPGGYLGFSSDDAAHIGNCRFGVMLEMKRGEYAAATDKDEVCDRIIDIVTSRCVPLGRFLIKDDQTWQVLENQALLRAFIARSLQDPDNEEEPHIPQIPVNDGIEVTTTNDHEDNKRNRSSSLLRTSYESAKRFLKRTRHGSHRNSKPNLLTTQRTPSQKTSPDAVRRAKIIRVPRQLDILVDDQNDFVTEGSHVGNTRFRVLLDLHKDTFRSGSLVEKGKVVETLLAIVKDKWNGRFLRATPGKGFKTIDDSKLPGIVTYLLCMNDVAEDTKVAARVPLPTVVSAPKKAAMSTPATKAPVISKDDAMAAILQLANMSEVDANAATNADGQRKSIMARFKSVVGPRKGLRYKRAANKGRRNAHSARTNSTSESTLPEIVLISSSAPAVAHEDVALEQLPMDDDFALFDFDASEPDHILSGTL